MAKVLDVKNLTISFRTNNGTVKAVRDISFSLEKGETLAIVGESGSGKSVTARAIMGILAPNAIPEGGKILYDGQDLMKIPEEDFHKLRGNRLAMIFQDPLSSLNPIIRIGKQLTEAIDLNGKANQKYAGEQITRLFKELENALSLSAPERPKAEIHGELHTLRQFMYTGTDFEKVYNIAAEQIRAALTDIDNLRIDLKEKEVADNKKNIKALLDELEGSFHPYLVRREDGKLTQILTEMKEALASYKEVRSASVTLDSADHSKQTVTSRNVEGADAFYPLFDRAEAVLDEANARVRPNFFAMGYYVTAHKEVVNGCEDIAALNTQMHRYLGEQFLFAFLEKTGKALTYSHTQANKGKQEALDALDAAADALRKGADVKAMRAEEKKLNELVEKGIDPLAIQKDSLAYTFAKALDDFLDLYEAGLAQNAKAKDGAKPYDEEHGRGEIVTVLTDLAAHYRAQLAEDAFDAAKAADALMDTLSAQASAKVYTISKKMARDRAIELMKEVGIPQPRKKFTQFPFEFSGGMRQRMVIAIALAANPDILICDEPTTALDVTIQAQILELINKLKAERQLSVIFITHDLGVVANMADKIGVMYAGKIVEYGTADDIFYTPAHPYTWALLSSMPDLDTKEKLEAIPGTPPNMIYPPKGDAFAARNKYAMQIDFEKQPPMFRISDTHMAATWLLHPGAPKVNPPTIVTSRIERMKKLEEEHHE